VVPAQAAQALLEHPEALPVLRPGVQARQVSGHDKSGLNKDGGNPEDPADECYLYRQADGGYVLFDEQGPGAITRLWFGWWNPDPPNSIGTSGKLKFYVDGEPTRSCITPIFDVAGKKVTTIEGLGANGLHRVQQAWIEEDVPQCGYCQVGMIMTTAALLAKNSKPSDAEIDEALDGHICRCGTYQRIRRAVHVAAKAAGKKPASRRAAGRATLRAPERGER